MGDPSTQPFEIYWWDLSADRMREAGVPTVKFSAAPNPDYLREIPISEETVADEAVPEEESWLELVRQWVGPPVLFVLLLFVLVPLLRRLLKEFEEANAGKADDIPRIGGGSLRSDQDGG